MIVQLNTEGEALNVTAKEVEIWVAQRGPEGIMQVVLRTSKEEYTQLSMDFLFVSEAAIVSKPFRYSLFSRLGLTPPCDFNVFRAELSRQSTYNMFDHVKEAHARADVRTAMGALNLSSLAYWQNELGVRDATLNQHGQVVGRPLAATVELAAVCRL